MILYIAAKKTYIKEYFKMHEIYGIIKEDDNQIRWLRILDGDIECDGSQRCTITYKDKKRDMSGVDYALLKV